MITSSPMDRYLARYPAASTALYSVILVGFIFAVGLSLLDTMERYRSIAQSTDLLARLEEHPNGMAFQGRMDARDMPPGSPFLEGSSATVASAALLQRVLGAVTRVGGNVLSSEVLAQSADKDKYLKVNVTCELNQELVQPLLYDLEAGMPFLFVNQFVVEAPPSSSERKSMHVSLAVSGLWPGAK